jgi:hypothetical protein
MRQVEFLEEYKRGTDTLSVGDRLTITDTEAGTLIRAGVAKCSVTGEQCARKPGAHVLKAEPVVHEA